MLIEQRRFSNRTRFDFDKEKFTYTTKDKSGSHTFSVRYAAIPLETRHLEERNSWYRNVGGFWVLIGALQIIYRYYDLGVLKGSFWLTLGLICFIIYWVVKTNYTILPSENGNIFIIKDKKHDDILTEIYSSRRDQLYNLYGTIDFYNDPQNETDKFQWLKEQKVISEEEFNQKVRQITLAHSKQIGES